MSGRHSALLLIDLQEAFFEEPALAAVRSEVIGSVRALAEGARRAEVRGRAFDHLPQTKQRRGHECP